MADKLKEIPGKILEWWNKFTNKQKTVIIAIVAAVVFTFAIIVYAFSRPQYSRLGTYDTSQEAAEVIDILDDAGITHRESADLRTIEVESSQLAQANYALAAGGYTPGNLKYGDFVETGMSTTSADRENQYTIYLQRQIEEALEIVNQVKDATVIISRPDQIGTLIPQQQEASASVQLTLDGTFTSTNAATMARSVANMLGNSTTANITIWDQDANLLFAGGDDYSASGIANSMQELQLQIETMLENKVRRVLLGTKQYNMIDVTSHLDIDFASYEETRKEYYANDDKDQGMLAERDKFTSESTNGVGGTPGTDSNGGDLTGYVTPDYSTSESSQEEISEKFLPNEWSQYIQQAAGTAVDYSNSSMSISMITFREYYEENVKNQGLLDGITWEEFKNAHSEDVRMEVAGEYYEMAANATGISADRITIIAYESPIFYDKEGVNISGTDVLSIVMIVLILALLGFVILRSMSSRKAVSEEEELSVESMLQSNPEPAIEDIDVETKSEVRKLIEKFVDDNPEAAANLLRNWLNEDWN